MTRAEAEAIIAALVKLRESATDEQAFGDGTGRIEEPK